jgi:signal transduction histidine kinase
LLHLLFNALAAMPKKGQLTIQARVTDEPEAAADVGAPAMVISVTDTGSGIASEDRERIFQPFFTTKPQGGLGLGLAICRGIVHAHEGRLLVDSTPGQGATFSICLPVGERLLRHQRRRVRS